MMSSEISLCFLTLLSFVSAPFSGQLSLVLCFVTQLCLTLCDPIERSPARLLCPCNSPGKNTGVGCHFLLQCMKVKSESEVAQLCPTLSDPVDCSLPGSSVHGIFQARVLEWGAIDFLLLTPKEDVLFIIGDGIAKVQSQEIPGVTGKFDLGVQNEAGQRLAELCQENTLVLANTLFKQHKRRLYTSTSPDGQY